MADPGLRENERRRAAAPGDGASGLASLAGYQRAGRNDRAIPLARRLLDCGVTDIHGMGYNRRSFEGMHHLRVSVTEDDAVYLVSRDKPADTREARFTIRQLDPRTLADMVRPLEVQPHIADENVAGVPQVYATKPRERVVTYLCVDQTAEDGGGDTSSLFNFAFLENPDQPMIDLRLRRLQVTSPLIHLPESDCHLGVHQHPLQSQMIHYDDQWRVLVRFGVPGEVTLPMAPLSGGRLLLIGKRIPDKIDTSIAIVPTGYRMQTEVLSQTVVPGSFSFAAEGPDQTIYLGSLDRLVALDPNLQQQWQVLHGGNGVTSYAMDKKGTLFLTTENAIYRLPL